MHLKLLALCLLCSLSLHSQPFTYDIGPVAVQEYAGETIKQEQDVNQRLLVNASANIEPTFSGKLNSDIDLPLAFSNFSYEQTLFEI